MRIGERLAKFGTEASRGLPSGGTGHEPTPASATFGAAWWGITALLWVGYFFTESLAFSVPATLLLLIGWLERLARTWDSWWKVLAYFAALAGSIAVPTVGGFFRSARLVDFSPDQMRFLNWGRVIDTTLLKKEFGFTPRWTTQQAFDDYVNGRGLKPLIDPETVEAAERGILDAAARFR
jgi:hypothetical protein